MLTPPWKYKQLEAQEQSIHIQEKRLVSPHILIAIFSMKCHNLIEMIPNISVYLL